MRWVRKKTATELQSGTMAIRVCLKFEYVVVKLHISGQAETEICYLHKNNYTFKLQITLDRHNLRLNLNDTLLPGPPIFHFKGR